jgi:hypothetical protein
MAEGQTKVLGDNSGEDGVNCCKFGAFRANFRCLWAQWGQCGHGEPILGWRHGAIIRPPNLKLGSSATFGHWCSFLAAGGLGLRWFPFLLPVPIMAFHGLIQSGAHSWVPFIGSNGVEGTPLLAHLWAKSAHFWHKVPFFGNQLGWPIMGCGCPQISTWAWPLSCQPMGTGAKSTKKVGTGRRGAQKGHCGAHVSTPFWHPYRSRKD